MTSLEISDVRNLLNYGQLDFFKRQIFISRKRYNTSRQLLIELKVNQPLEPLQILRIINIPLKILMLERLFRRDPSLLIILQHFIEQIQRRWIFILDRRPDVHSRFYRERLDEFQGIRVLDNRHFILGRRPQCIDDILDLLDIILPRKEHPPR